MRIGIVTDSTADLPSDVASSYGVRVVPLEVRFGDETFKDGIDITADQFYGRLQSSPVMPVTSQPSVGDFVSVYRELSRSIDVILSIHISSRLSGTLNSATLAAREAAVNVIHFDSKTASQGVARSVITAARAVRAGFDLNAITKIIDKSIASTFSVFAVDTLEYLRRNGRIGRAVALLGGMLRLKPILYADSDGMVSPLDKVRGKSGVIPKLLSNIGKRFPAGSSLDVSVVHSGAESEAVTLLSEIKKTYKVMDVQTGIVGPAIGAHIGPGAIGAMVQPHFDAMVKMALENQGALAVH